MDTLRDACITYDLPEPFYSNTMYIVLTGFIISDATVDCSIYAVRTNIGYLLHNIINK